MGILPETCFQEKRGRILTVLDTWMSWPLSNLVIGSFTKPSAQGLFRNFTAVHISGNGCVYDSL